MSAEQKQIKSYCENCQNDTKHYVLYSRNEPNDDFESYRFERIFLTVQCMGCENVSFRQEDHEYEVTYPDEDNNWTYEITTHIYPKPLKKHKILNGIYLLPAQLRTVYSETIDALKANCKLLAGVGFRAVIEAVCIDKEISGRTLEQKINNLAKSRLITDKEAERLHAVRFIGNDSVHEMAVPQEKALYVVLEIIEHLLSNLYIIDHLAKPVLDTFINSYGDFEELLMKKLKMFNKGDDFPLAKYIAKDVRRLNGQIMSFEAELISQINAGEFTLLTLGNVKHFGINTNEIFQHFIKQ